MNNNVVQTYKYPFFYNGNIVWPILFLIFFPPIGIALLLLKAGMRKEGKRYTLLYKGSDFWLIFWSVLFFPIAIVLGLFNGFDAVVSPDYE